MSENTFAVRNPEMERKMRQIAERIGNQLPDGWGFNLLLFEYADEPGGNLFYISSAQRSDVIKVMKEWIARNEH